VTHRRLFEGHLSSLVHRDLKATTYALISVANVEINADAHHREGHGSPVMLIVEPHLSKR